jgi:RHS repeat-associated protein
VLSQNDASAAVNRIGYAGYFFEPATQTYLVRNREYDPNTGVWDERDPIGYHDGSDLYNYTASSPVSFIDTYGLLSRLAEPEPPCKETVSHCLTSEYTTALEGGFSQQVVTPVGPGWIEAWVQGRARIRNTTCYADCCLGGYGSVSDTTIDLEGNWELSAGLGILRQVSFMGWECRAWVGLRGYARQSFSGSFEISSNSCTGRSSVSMCMNVPFTVGIEGGADARCVKRGRVNSIGLVGGGSISCQARVCWIFSAQNTLRVDRVELHGCTGSAYVRMSIFGFTLEYSRCLFNC